MAERKPIYGTPHRGQRVVLVEGDTEVRLALRYEDCPCHGGRFAPTGQALNGPPPTDLANHDD